MNSNEIERLLEKFYEAGTTPAEERQLREFFSGEAVPPHLAEHADLFRFYREEKKEKLPDPEFESRFLAAIKETPSIPEYSKRKRTIYLTGVAALVLLLIGIFFTYRNPSINNEEAEIAYQQAEYALAMVSVNLNSGLVQMQKLDNFEAGLNQAQKLKAFQTGLDQMTKFSKFYQYQQIIINPGDQHRP
ncbi:MAG: hypothetical protein NTW10_09050 [Bacteroidetes bacterium]|nr:hypothetical protein [Bacteroidota bacterium]